MSTRCTEASDQSVVGQLEVVGRVGDQDVPWMQSSEPRVSGDGSAERCAGGSEPVGVEALPRFLPLPDADDSEAFVGGACDLQDEPLRDGSAEC